MYSIKRNYNLESPPNSSAQSPKEGFNLDELNQYLEYFCAFVPCMLLLCYLLRKVFFNNVFCFISFPVKLTIF